jgi:AhpD family alkylhydroperoxidase
MDTTTTTVEPRITNPAFAVPGAMDALQALSKAISRMRISPRLLELMHLRASQINGCGVCVDSGTCSLKQAGETDERLLAVAAWKEAPYFSEAERAALALTEAVTRLSDRADPVPDAIWQEATRHYDEPALAALILSIATTNLFNRLNVTTGQVAGPWG